MINNRSFSSRYEKSSGRHVVAMVAMWLLCSRCGRYVVALGSLGPLPGCSRDAPGTFSGRSRTLLGRLRHASGPFFRASRS